jgi:hypothetical protein
LCEEPKNFTAKEFPPTFHFLIIDAALLLLLLFSRFATTLFTFFVYTMSRERRTSGGGTVAMSVLALNSIAAKEQASKEAVHFEKSHALQSHGGMFLFQRERCPRSLSQGCIVRSTRGLTPGISRTAQSSHHESFRNKR